MSDVLDLPAAPIEAEPLCELCGCTIEDLEELIYLRAAGLLAQWELADPRDAWRHTGEAPPPAEVRNGSLQAARSRSAKPYRTPESTIDAFWYVARNHDAAYLTRWLEQHPQDIATLTRLWEAKNGHS
jgi:hypothetical protein